MIKLNNKKTEKIFILRRKKFGRIDSRIKKELSTIKLPWAGTFFVIRFKSNKKHKKALVYLSGPRIYLTKV